MKNNELWKIVHIGHIGVGSIVGMTSKGNEQNKQQKFLREVWNKSKKLVGMPNELILGGEIIEGNNPKQFAEDIWLPEKLDQLNMSFDLVMEWIDHNIIEEVLILYGHIYHGSKEMRVEEILAQRLRDNGVNAKAGVLFERKYFGKIFRFWHGSSGAFVYKASSKEREIKFNLIASALEKTNKFDEQFTYHNHQSYSAMFSNVNASSCPAFKLIDKYAELKHPDVWLPDIGLITTTFERRFKETRVNNDVITYNVPFRAEDLEEAIKKNIPKAKLQWKEFKVAITKPNHKQLKKRWSET